jgi:hypothetical protein
MGASALSPAFRPALPPMRAFTFRLEQALRWRATQVNLGKTRAAAAAGRVAGINREIEARTSELVTAATRILDTATGGSLESYARFKEKSHASIRDLEGQALVARRTLTLELNRLMEANQKLRLLENFKRASHGRWRKEFDRELSDFADEAFLQGMER